MRHSRDAIARHDGRASRCTGPLCWPARALRVIARGPEVTAPIRAAMAYGCKTAADRHLSTRHHGAFHRGSHALSLLHHARLVAVNQERVRTPVSRERVVLPQCQRRALNPQAIACLGMMCVKVAEHASLSPYLPSLARNVVLMPRRAVRIRVTARSLLSCGCCPSDVVGTNSIASICAIGCQRRALNPQATLHVS